ncbi:MutS-related protein [Pedobacter psychroterrae]|uniref:DNA mismatch repair protein n=1 Tax=Pedobacter psychroterrae TaxID=2530453 RepID=A0A4R0NHN1_9SPHI|nr:DNA mismatch repair protein [Pedobacter psychroterrae]TCC98274.1 DNA mismatch repair protein [Pedobacter psychroterrae]
MSFIADRQTLEDLNMLGKHRHGSVYSIFNKTKTRGGERLLEQWFQSPLQAPEEINKRSSLFSFIHQLDVDFPFDPVLFSKAENYLESAGPASFPFTVADIALKKLKGSFFHDYQFNQTYEGLMAAIQFLRDCVSFIGKMERAGDGIGKLHFENERAILSRIFDDERLQWLMSKQAIQQCSFMEVCRYDYLLRQGLAEEMKVVLESVYRLDVYTSVATVAAQRNFSYAEALAASENCFETSGLWHPSLIKGVANVLDFDRNKNMLFLTGANMAGKSTLMKAFGIVVYLAHMGFPVPAGKLRFSVMQGLYSSINVSDNLNSGYSHFYAEVLRVKTVAEQVSNGLRLVVLFDELFKGTNVKDAFDATLEVTKAFSEYKKSFFIISTHIIEVGEKLIENEKLRAVYLPTLISGNTPKYTYKLEPGITSDRQGMLIIQNEGILELLAEDSTNSIKNRQ